MPNPKAAQKRRDLLDKGLQSIYVSNDFYVLKQVFDDMEAALNQSQWLLGDTYGIADTAIVAYIDRLDRLGMAGLWEGRTPKVGEWLAASRARPSYGIGISDHIADADAHGMRSAGGAQWPKAKEIWDGFLARSS